MKEKIDIVIDFDGTVVTHAYPYIGKDIGSVPVLKKLIENGHRLVLSTMRGTHNTTLLEAINWFEGNGIALYGVQTNPTQKHWTNSPKCYGELIIDDAGLGIPLKYDKEISPRPFVDWVEVEQLLIEKKLINESI
jgi:hypothetical protein